MKLGKLNAAIDAAPDIFIRTSGLGLLALKKGSMKDALKRKFPEGRAAETGYRLDEDHAFAPDTNPDTNPT
jgi:hypothetical protein